MAVLLWRQQWSSTAEDPRLPDEVNGEVWLSFPPRLVVPQSNVSRENSCSELTFNTWRFTHILPHATSANDSFRRGRGSSLPTGSSVSLTPSVSLVAVVV